MSEWIRFKDKNPPINVNVILCTNGRTVQDELFWTDLDLHDNEGLVWRTNHADLVDDSWPCRDDDLWQPLPEPPED